MLAQNLQMFFFLNRLSLSLICCLVGGHTERIANVRSQFACCPTSPQPNVWPQAKHTKKTSSLIDRACNEWRHKNPSIGEIVSMASGRPSLLHFVLSSLRILANCWHTASRAWPPRINLIYERGRTRWGGGGVGEATGPGMPKGTRSQRRAD